MGELVGISWTVIAGILWAMSLCTAWLCCNAYGKRKSKKQGETEE